MRSAVRRQVTVRPTFSRAIRPASSSTFRCFITAGKVTPKGSASALTLRPSASINADRIARRVGSASAEKVRLSAASSYFTIRLSNHALPFPSSLMPN